MSDLADLLIRPAAGRQMWLQVKAVDAAGGVMFEDGRLHDAEKTRRCGERARNLPSSGPCGEDCKRYATWGRILHDLWEKSGRGPAVDMGPLRPSSS